MTAPTILEPAEMRLLARATMLYDAMCECGRHTVTLTEPICCNRCGANSFTVARVTGEFTQHRPNREDL
jgi:hypothetical protein